MQFKSLLFKGQRHMKMSQLDNQIQIGKCILQKKKKMKTAFGIQTKIARFLFFLLFLPSHSALWLRKESYRHLNFERIKILTWLCFLWFIFILEDFAHVFTEYGNCFTFNHGETIRVKEKVSVSGRGLHLLFNVKQVLNFFKLHQGSRQTRMHRSFRTLCPVESFPHICLFVCF